jgi:gamma-glutamyltranspeptidase/glutathione hydrolase
MNNNRKFTTLFIGVFCVLFFLVACQGSTPNSAQPLPLSQHLPQQKLPQQAAIASAHPLATEAGMKILAQGGNAFDAAVAIAATLAVVEPYSSGLGGGGLWLLHRARDQQNILLDARETAPAAATETLYLKKTDAQKIAVVDRDLATNGALAAAIPGIPAALHSLTQDYGQLRLADNLSTAIELAEKGVVVDKLYSHWLSLRREVLQRYPASTHFVLNPGDTLKQPQLATTLHALATQGRDGFYQGAIANELIQQVKAQGGIWTADDLRGYQVKYRQPIVGQYRDMRIISAPPPSSGGLLLVNMLNMLEPYDLQSLTPVAQTHLLTEIMRRAYQQRSLYLADSDFIDIPYAKFTDKAAAKMQMQNFNPQQASVSVPQGQSQQGDHTTHFVVLDQQGNRVSATLSINLAFGSALTVAGVLLNNEMDDFDAASHQANAYGLVGSGANRIQPGKRPLSSMSPTFIETPDGVGLLGTPGGSRIISMVLLGILQAEQHRDPYRWVARPRFHHQYLPDQIEHETNALTDTQLQALRAMGHRLSTVQRPYGNMHAIFWHRTTGQVQAASDPRGSGRAVVWKQPVRDNRYGTTIVDEQMSITAN